MSSLQLDPAYIAGVLNKLTNNPTSQDMDYLVEAYTRLGYWSAQLNGEADQAESERKNAEANSVLAAKSEDPKMSAAMLEARSLVETHDLRTVEIRARTNARKVYNLQLAVEQAINAIKHLERNTGVRLGA